jgi:predicted nucleotidyltransferase
MNPETEHYREQLRAMLPELADRFGVAELGLFGSRVRGDHRPDSDLDVLVTFQPGRTPGLIRFGELEAQIADRLGVVVDLVPSDSLRPHVEPSVRREVVYL